MKPRPCSLWLTASAAAALSLILAGCAVPASGPEEPAANTGGSDWLAAGVAEGRVSPSDVEDLNYIRHELSRVGMVRNVRFTTMTDDQRVFYPRITYYLVPQHEDDMTAFVDILPDTIAVEYSPGSVGYLPAWKVAFWLFTYPEGEQYWLDSHWTQESAQRFADALRRVVLHFREERNALDEKELARFADKVAAWRASGSPQDLPDAARQHLVIAQNAFAEKNLNKAATEFDAALQAYPFQPAVEYNLALIVGEMHGYRAAAFDLKKYLLLAPDAPDAAAARDQIAIWQDKVDHK